jgi:DNA-directed RNA polymerase subunit beta
LQFNSINVVKTTKLSVVWLSHSLLKKRAKKYLFSFFSSKAYFSFATISFACLAFFYKVRLQGNALLYPKGKKNLKEKVSYTITKASNKINNKWRDGGMRSISAFSLEGQSTAKRKGKALVEEITSNKPSVIAKEYSLETFHRSNQDTCLFHNPVVSEGDWIQAGDLLADCAASSGGELSLGKNILVAYMPWEGYNFEDAILISERLVYDDVYSSIHIERYDIEIRETKFGMETITRNIPDLAKNQLDHLDSNGVAKLGSWIKEGDILVGRITPINKKAQSTYQNLLYTILDKSFDSVRDSSLRAPKGIKAKVVNIQIYKLGHYNSKLKVQNNVKFSIRNLKKIAKKSIFLTEQKKAGLCSDLVSYFKKSYTNFNNRKIISKAKGIFPTMLLYARAYNSKKLLKTSSAYTRLAYPQDRGCFFKKLLFSLYTISARSFLKHSLKKSFLKAIKKKGAFFRKSFPMRSIKKASYAKLHYNLCKLRLRTCSRGPAFKGLGPLQGPLALVSCNKAKNKPFGAKCLNAENTKYASSIANGYTPTRSVEHRICSTLRVASASMKIKNMKINNNIKSGFEIVKLNQLFKQSLKKQKINETKKSFFATQKKKKENKINQVYVYLAEKRKIQVGDKMAGRHGNKGIVSLILPRQDMPFLPNGTPIDMVLNPLGVPSRMNVGQIYECLLGLAAKYLGEHYKIFPFDEIYGPEASRSFVYSKLNEARLKTKNDWLFNPNSPGKTRLFDGRTGEPFHQFVTVGYAYMLKLVHLVDDKIHMRSTGPYSLVTQQPLRGRSKQGGQRLGEMEVWALEGYGAAFTLLEMLTIKSDDISGRMTLWSNLILNKEISIGTPESFKVLVCELQALCLDIGIFRIDSIGKLSEIESLTQLP